MMNNELNILIDILNSCNKFSQKLDDYNFLYNEKTLIGFCLRGYSFDLIEMSPNKRVVSSVTINNRKVKRLYNKKVKEFKKDIKRKTKQRFEEKQVETYNAILCNYKARKTK